MNRSEEEEQDRGARQEEYIIKLVRKEREKGAEIRGDGLENGHLLG